ncbi:MAG TPA: hypothetical protein VN048_07830 [Verrucomicrobiae bacterium]|nr:hypothetical protein [Verrucomicrobiae bacterium]
MKVSVKTGRQGFRWVRLGSVAAVSLCLASGAVFAAQTTDVQAPPPTVMPWVSDVVKMNDAGIAPDVIANYVRNTDARSTLSADDIIYLRDHGISTGLITTMIQHGAVAPSAPAAQTVPLPATPAPAPAYAQYPSYTQSPAPDYSAYQQQPDVNYNYYSYPNYGYNTPYYWNYYYPYYPVWYYPYGFGFRNRFCFRPGFGHVGFVGGFHGGTVHAFSSVHFSGGMGGHGGRR